MPSISELFMNRRRLFLFGVVFVVFVLLFLGVLRTNPLAPAGSPELTASSESRGYQAAVLVKFKSKYVGNHVNVGNLLRNLPYGELIRNGISLQTEKTENKFKTAETKSSVMTADAQFTIHRDNMIKAYDELLKILTHRIRQN